jgi:hypothetical protein
LAMSANQCVERDLQRYLHALDRAA